MGLIATETIAVITRETRLKGLLARWGTRGQARFRLEQAQQHEQFRHQPATPKTRGAKTKLATATPVAANSDADFAAYEEEDHTYTSVIERLKNELDLGYPVTVVDRQYLPTYDFRACLAVVVVGQDGLVANAAKYVGDKPIIAVNPDPKRFDGVLLPFQVHEARKALQGVIQRRAKTHGVTLAQAELDNGQTLLAFNDLFVGAASHVSARYVLKVDGKSEPQSSSGMIISTGAGSTGWLSSLFNMYRGFGRWQGQETQTEFEMSWDDARLAWVVREPFQSKQSQTNLVAGMLRESEELVIESMMPARGVIFSDGVEADFLEFNSGTIARIRRANQQAQLVVG